MTTHPDVNGSPRIPAADVERLVGAIQTATNMKPGDRILITTEQQFPPEVAAGFADQLRECFPGVDFVLVAGVSGIAVDRQDETDLEGDPTP